MIFGGSRCLSSKYPICSRKSTNLQGQKPPEALIVVPLMAAAAGEHRKEMISAI